MRIQVTKTVLERHTLTEGSEQSIFYISLIQTPAGL